MPDIVVIRITFIKVKNPFLVVIWFKTGQKKLKRSKIDFLWKNIDQFAILGPTEY